MWTLRRGPAARQAPIPAIKPAAAPAPADGEPTLGLSSSPTHHKVDNKGDDRKEEKKMNKRPSDVER